MVKKSAVILGILAMLVMAWGCPGVTPLASGRCLEFPMRCSVAEALA